MKRFYIFNTGCIRRGLDSIRIYNYLITNKWVFTREISSADLVIVTTCGAVQEKEDGSLHAIETVNKKRSKSSKLVVTGCLTKINPSKIHKIGAFEFVPTGNYNNFDKLLNSKIAFESVPESNTITDNTDILNYVLAYRLFRNSGFWVNIFNKFSNHRIFLKSSIILSDIINFVESTIRLTKPQKIVPYYNINIADGCMGVCTFCAIKTATGPLRSKPIEKIIDEFKTGLNNGYKFIQLVSEDTGCYGMDIGTTVINLLKRIFEIEGDYKLILIDFNPRWLIKYYDELLPVFIENQDRIKEIFIPVQSGSNKILKLMKRHCDIEEVRHKLKDLNKKVPKIKIRTTIIVGFPGEIDDDFNKSKELVQDVNFFEVTLNKYEDRPNTPSSKMENKIPKNIINNRIKELTKYLG